MSVCPAIPAIRRFALWLAFLACGLAAFNGTVRAQTVNMTQETACGGISLWWLSNLADAGAPTVIFVPGRGAVDWKGNTPDVAYNTTLSLAIALGETGIGVMTFDKRGVGDSRVADGKAWDSSTTADEAKDIRCLVNWLREKHPPSRITLIGSSDGGVVAALAAMTVAVDAIVMLPVFEATAPEMIQEMRQGGLSEAATREIEQAVAARLKGEEANYSHPILHRPVDTIIHRLTQMRPPFNRTDLVAHLDLPILLVSGGWDFESSRAEIRRLAASAPHLTAFAVADMSSRLRPYTAECPDSCQQERNPGGSQLQPGAVKAIATFTRCGTLAADPNTCHQAAPPPQREPRH